MRPLRRIAATLFAGDPRVWRTALAAGVPLLAIIAFYALKPRAYYTGTNSVEMYSYIAPAGAGQPVCIPDLSIPPGTRRLRLDLLSGQAVRPAMALTLSSAGAAPVMVGLAQQPAPANRATDAVFGIPPLPTAPVSACISASGPVTWGGTPLPAPPATAAPTAAGRPIAGRLAVWYLPRAGAQRSYLARAGSILHRASLFRPGFVGPWLYVAILALVLPVLALTVIRSLAVAAAGGPRPGGLRTATVLFAVAAVNFACWALITPPFQAPDEVDHFAYTQSLVERGVAPSRAATSPLPRWSAAESLALQDMSFFTDHQVGNTRLPWREQEQSAYDRAAATTHPSASDGGGNETAASHGPLYYAALAPAYALASGSPLDQLTLMRLASALIGALAVLFAYLLTRELAPRRPWLAIAVAALVAYQPMYGFISGAVNNDVGVNAGAAALELLLVLLVRRGFRPALALLAGAVLLALPAIKGTAYSLYPVAAIALLATAWRHRAQIRGWALFAAAAGASYGAVRAVASAFSSSASEGAGSAGPGAAGGAVSEALAHPFGYAAYVWQVFLPRLPGMARHFEAGTWPAYVIFVERGFGAFGWYDVFFSGWVYVLICAAMLAVLPLGILAARRERAFVRANAVEAALLVLMPLAVVAGVEAAFYTTGTRPVIAEFGRYAFPAIVPLAVLVVAALHAFPRRWVLPAGSALVTAMVALSYAAQLVTLTGFYA